jgi:integrase
MLNVNFNLRKQDNKSPQIIYLVLRWGGNVYRYTTKYNVFPAKWDSNKQAFKLDREKKNPKELLQAEQIEANRLIAEKNVYLAKMKKAVLDEYERATATQVLITKEYFKNFLDRWTNRKVDEKPNFWKFVNSYIDNSINRIDPKTGRTISKRTIQEYNTTKGLLQEFEKENGDALEFETLSLATLIDFRDYLTTVKTYTVKDKITEQPKEAHYSLNNIAKHIDNLRQFLRAAAASKIIFDTDVIDNKKFTNAREIAYNVYLNETELAAIANLDLSTSARLDRARDLFLIGCYTGLRVSDYNNIKPHHIKGEFIDLYQTKTGGRVVIPIHHTVKALLKKYNGATPPKISEQKLNEYIKEVCKKAGIVEHTEKQRTKGGSKEATVLEKWQMVSSHTARRSFATNMTKQGLPIQTVMSLTGHTKPATFLKYVKLTATEHAEIVREHWQEREMLQTQLN